MKNELRNKWKKERNGRNKEIALSFFLFFYSQNRHKIYAPSTFWFGGQLNGALFLIWWVETIWRCDSLWFVIQSMSSISVCVCGLRVPKALCSCGLWTVWTHHRSLSMWNGIYKCLRDNFSQSEMTIIKKRLRRAGQRTTTRETIKNPILLWFFFSFSETFYFIFFRLIRIDFLCCSLFVARCRFERNDK